MSYLNYDDVVTQLTLAGLILKDGLRTNTSRPVRCKVEGDREPRGWYRLYELPLDSGTLITGSYGVWRGNDNGATKIELPKTERKALSAEQLEAIKKRQAEDRRRAESERQAEIDRAAQRAGRWWSQCLDHGTNAYLVKKGLPAGKLYGARLSPDGNLVIPLQDTAGKVYGLQVIYHDPKIKERKGRDKDYTPRGLEKKGRFFMMGSPAAGSGVVLVAEGFATAASLHEATGLPVAVAFDANNLLPVAEALAKHYSRLRPKFIFCADDDYLGTCKHCNGWTLTEKPTCTHCGEPHGKKNTGIECASLAAMALDGYALIPQWPAARPTTHKGPTDFNDLHVHPQGGLSAVRAQVEALLPVIGASLRPSAAPPRLGADTTGGGGDSNMPSVLSVQEAQNRYVFIYGGKGTLFDCVDHSLVPKADVVDMLPEHGWRDLRGIKQVARLNQVGFDPAGTDANILCNLYGGWPTTPKAGDCERLLNLLEYLCSNEQNPRDLYQWVLKWLAYPIQHPGAKMRTALIFHGPQGTGKNLFFESIMSIYGDYGRIVDQVAVEDKFNDWASRKLFLIADEVVARQELYHVKNKLKQFVTGEWIRINPKNVAAHDEKNHVNVVFLSNEAQPLVLEKDDRRYCVVYCPPADRGDLYLEVRDCINAGGIAALHDYLLNLELGEFDEHTKPPKTIAKENLIDISLGSVERFVRDWLAGDTDHPVCPCGSDQLFRAYKRHCSLGGVAKPREAKDLIGYVRNLAGWEYGHRDRYDNCNFTGSTRRQRMIIPATQDIQRWMFAAKKTDNAFLPDPGTPKNKWHTVGYIEFEQSLATDEGWGSAREAA